MSHYPNDAHDRAWRLADRQARLQDAQDLSGALRQFDRDAAWERLQESKAGNQNITQLEQTLALERQQIVDDWAKEAVEVEKRAAEERMAAQQAGWAEIAQAQGDWLAASGRGYTNEAYQLVQRINQLTANGNVGADLIDRLFRTSAQNIIDGAELTGAAFNDLLQWIPQLSGVVHEFTGAAEEEARRLQDAAREFADFTAGVARTITDFIAGVRGGGLYSPALTVGQTAADFNAQYALAASGNRDAASGITQYAQRAIDALKAMYGSSSTAQAGIEDILMRLGALPGQMSAEQFIVNAIVDMKTVLQGAINANSPTAIASALSGYFNAIDSNTDDMISYNEMVSALGSNFSSGTWRSILSTLDADGDDQISRLEAIKGSTAGTQTAVNISNTDYLRNISTGSTTSVGSQFPDMQSKLVGVANNTASNNTQLVESNRISALNYSVLTHLETMMRLQNRSWGAQSISDIGGFAKGTNYAPPGLHWVGEEGPELLRFRGGEQVIPHNVSMELARARGWSSNDNRVVEELKAVRAELADIKRNTGQTVRAVVAGAEHVGEKIDGTSEVARDYVREQKMLRS